PRSTSISPFAADSARKNVPKAESSGDISATAPRPASSTNAGTNVVIMGSTAPAVVEIVSDPQPQPQTTVSAEALRDVVLGALGSQPMLVSMLETAQWALEGSTLIAKVASSTTMIDMSFTADARRIATAAASGAASKPVKVLVQPGGTVQPASSIPRSSSN